jgi:hypothetical protein
MVALICHSFSFRSSNPSTTKKEKRKTYAEFLIQKFREGPEICVSNKFPGADFSVLAKLCCNTPMLPQEAE